MNQKKGFADPVTIRIIAFVVVVVIMFGYYVSKEKEGTIPQVTTTVRTEVTEEKVAVVTVAKPESIKEGSSFFDLINSGKSYQCTYSVPKSENTGSVFISGGKLRDELVAKIGSVSTKSVIVFRDSNTYTWTSLNPNTVFKKNIEGKEGFEAGPASVFYLSNKDPINSSYTCTTWIPNENAFNLPKEATIVNAENSNAEASKAFEE